MLTFLRKIRQRLVSENKVRSYLIYAIGEILLVVIGILIALQVNNWNQDQKALRQEQQIISALHNEFNENLKELQKDIRRLDNQGISQRKVFNYFGATDLPSEHEFNSLISQTFANLTWNPGSYVLNDLKSSGQISRLSNAKLQLLLFDWERHYEDLEEFKSDDKTSSDAFLDFLKKNGSLRNIDYNYVVNTQKEISRSHFAFSNLELLKNLTFENIVDDKLMTTGTLLSRYELTIEKIEDILKATQP
jgi:hypothetical protein